MLASSVATIVAFAFSESGKATDESETSQAHMEVAKCLLLEDYYGNRKKELLAELGFDEKEAGAFTDAVRKMFL
jgi:hypothetical protein